MTVGRTLAALVVLGVAAGAVPIGEAQETAGFGPSLTLIGAAIDIDAGKPRTVDATYRFRVDGEGVPSTITGRIWRFPGRDLDGVSVWVNDRDVDPSVDRQRRHVTIGVPIVTGPDDGPIAVRLRYSVSGPNRRLKVPLWIPEFGTAGTHRTVGIALDLPAGTEPRSAPFPDADTRERDGDGLVLRYRLLHVPGFVFLEYGRSGRPVTVSQAVGVAGVLAIVGALSVWLVYIRRGEPRTEGG